MKLLKYLAEEVVRQKVNISCKKTWSNVWLQGPGHMGCGKLQSDSF